MKATDEQIAQELHATCGNISVTAKKLGMSRTALYKRIQRAPELQIAFAEGRARLIGEAYSGLVKAVEEGRGWAIALVLKTIGRDEGFTERVEVTSSLPVEADW